jgi:hypothetical protein
LNSNAAIENAQDCVSQDPANATICVGKFGGTFSLTRADSTWVSANSGEWNGTVDELTGGTVLQGWATGDFGSGIKVTGMPLQVWSYSDPFNRTALGLGYNSSVLAALTKNGFLSENTPKVIGIDMGSRSENNGTTGSVKVGAWDNSRTRGPITWFPMGKRYAGLDCQLQVLVNDMVLSNTEGSNSMFPQSSRIPFCIDPIQNAHTLPTMVYNAWANLTKHPTTQPTDGSEPFTDQTYPWSSAALIGDVFISIDNGQGGAYNSTIPKYEMLSHERGSDANGRYSIINNTRAMAQMNSPATGILGLPLLGGTFLSQNYLVVDYERNVFGLAPAVIGKDDLSSSSDICPSGNDQHSQPSAIVIALATLFALCALGLLSVVARFLRKRTCTASTQANPSKDTRALMNDTSSRV